MGEEPLWWRFSNQMATAYLYLFPLQWLHSAFPLSLHASQHLSQYRVPGSSSQWKLPCVDASDSATRGCYSRLRVGRAKSRSVCKRWGPRVPLELELRSRAESWSLEVVTNPREACSLRGEGGAGRWMASSQGILCLWGSVITFSHARGYQCDVGSTWARAVS